MTYGKFLHKHLATIVYPISVVVVAVLARWLFKYEFHWAAPCLVMLAWIIGGLRIDWTHWNDK